MQRVIVDHYGGPEVVRVMQDEVPRPAPGEVRVRVLAAGVSFTDSQLRAGTYIPGGPKPPFTPVVASMGTALTEAQLRMVAQGLAAPTTRSAVIRGVQQSTSPGNVAWGAVTVLIRP